MKKLRALIIEDEQPAREELKYLLQEYEDIEVVGEADNGITGLHLIEKLKPDVIFLDINIPKIHGCELARHISAVSEIGKPPFVVFVTAYDIHAIDAFEIGVVDYLLKPISHHRLYKTLEKIRSLYKETEIPIRKLAVEKNERIKLLDLEEIVFAEAHEGNVLINTKNETFIYKGTIKSLEEKLKDRGFFRVQKSYIVNLNKIAEILPWFKGTYWLVMEDNKKTQIPVSKSQIKELKALLGLDRET
ncbi:two-component system response regulator LytT [Caldanaerobacter subterraneus subsp. tengcongensis MB4]|uniref:Stage 0 sporulation protein A homolog n=1 Tax=Caldanaerobacter subterraneus subsp. tengcongensis (strain DSM 15242 / JCM 11007 / NBRC 100824 / MB4) TaxID=273068 RepID=Q8RBF0_CALS4|nr:LytTR family DNA-binding domain-containing protein [Caldanaerobacter subterraneus]AAM24126.1 Response regulators of cell autolysis [Caldanaerobacter subterraneus subsp. tengcongensis MB4]MCS3916351.1 two-component system response regulator LytT [Caldanaerobacter subterraneus subsp. tengcongensis MB4]